MAITDAEMRIMQALWHDSPMTSASIGSALAAETDWREGTIKALLNRMLKKGVIEARREGRRYLYSPTVKREDCLGAASARFLDRWFDGHVTPLVALLSETRQLDRRELEQLHRLIEELKDHD